MSSFFRGKTTLELSPSIVIGSEILIGLSFLIMLYVLTMWSVVVWNWVSKKYGEVMLSTPFKLDAFFDRSFYERPGVLPAIALNALVAGPLLTLLIIAVNIATNSGNALNEFDKALSQLGICCTTLTIVPLVEIYVTFVGYILFPLFRR